MAKCIDHYLDITPYVCPITFVRTKLLLEQMKPGEVAEIRLTSGEPLENVPRSVIDQGHTVLEIIEERTQSGLSASVHVLRLRKNPGR